jgi:hypothetical protein
MRLIDVDELKKQIAGMTIKNHYSAKRANALCKLLEEQPTAFDVEKVTDEILRASCIARPMGWDRKREIIETHTAIEIVKGGGVE